MSTTIETIVARYDQTPQITVSDGKVHVVYAIKGTEDAEMFSVSQEALFHWLLMRVSKPVKCKLSDHHPVRIEQQQPPQQIQFPTREEIRAKMDRTPVGTVVVMSPEWQEQLEKCSRGE